MPPAVGGPGQSWGWGAEPGELVLWLRQVRWLHAEEVTAAAVHGQEHVGGVLMAGG